MPEPLEAIRLKYKAQRLRRETGDDRYVAPIEMRHIEWSHIIGQTLGKPVHYCLFVDQPMYKKQYEANGNRPLPHEIRLRPALVGSIVLTVALFWFAAASFPSVSFWCAIVAGCFVAMGIFLVFLCLLTYITEVYLVNAASALAANTVVRSAFGCGFPMFGKQMYDTLKPRYASVILGFIALAMEPIPFVFYKYGDRIRALSRNAPGHHESAAEASEAPPTGADQA